jgi:hypothetical protein
MKEIYIYVYIYVCVCLFNPACLVGWIAMSLTFAARWREISSFVCQTRRALPWQLRHLHTIYLEARVRCHS